MSMKGAIVRKLLDVFVNTPNRNEGISRYLARKLRDDVTARIISKGSAEVLTGGFAGLQVPTEIRTRNFAAAHLFGTYEQTVVEFLLSAARGRGRFLDIGCGAGFFTNGIGLKRDISVIGFDVDLSMVRQAELVRNFNGLENVSHELVSEATTYDQIIREDDLVLVDVEGAEYHILRPDVFPILTKADYIIELHGGEEYDEASGKDELIRRFASTHQATTLRQRLHLDFNEEIFRLYPWLTNYMYHISAFEYRRVPQNWLVLERR